MPHLTIDSPIRHKRYENQNNFADNFDFVNGTFMKTATMPNFGIVETTWH